MTRYIRIGSLVQRVNSLQKTSALLGKSSLTLASTTKATNTFEQFNKRYSSSHHGHNEGDFKRSVMIYTLLGAGVAAGIFGYFYTEEKPDLSKKAVSGSTKRYTSSSSSTKAEKEEEAAPAAEEEAVQEEEEVKVVVEAKKPAEPKKPEVSSSTTVAKRESNQDRENKQLPEIPNHVPYLIIGGGTAALSAFKAIRASDPVARILVVTEEAYMPYMRPPLSKELWMTDDEKLVEELRFKLLSGNERSLYFLEDEFYVPVKTLNEEENGGVAVLTGKRVIDVDIQNKLVKLDNNWEIAYDKCLIATGGRPRNLPAFEKQWSSLKDNVTLFRNIEDFKKLYAIAKEGKTIAIVGGGFLGSELAYALAHLSRKYKGKVVQIFPESGNLGKVLPQYLSEWTTKQILNEGVEIIPKAGIQKAQLNDSKVELTIENLDKSSANNKKNWLLADHVVVAVGLEANVQLAKKSGFEIDPNLGGYVVNAELQARNSIWVAGDAACFYDINLGRRRVEHHDHAVVSGRLAGENMTGAGKPYWHQSMFWSDLGPRIGFEAIGLVDSSLQTVGLFAKADENDTPAAFANENNTSLRSEVDSSTVQEELSKESKGEPRKPLSSDDYGKGAILYLKNDVIVGVLLWNLFRRIPIARQLIQNQVKVGDYGELAKLFDIDATGLSEEEEK